MGAYGQAARLPFEPPGNILGAASTLPPHSGPMGLLEDTLLLVELLPSTRTATHRQHFRCDTSLSVGASQGPRALRGRLVEGLDSGTRSARRELLPCHAGELDYLPLRLGGVPALPSPDGE